MKLEIAVSWLLRIGVAISTLLILIGLLIKGPLLQWGLLALMATPLCRILLCFSAFIIRRDLIYSLLTAWVLINIALILFLT
jgi:uncharacterized membrane protein